MNRKRLLVISLIIVVIIIGVVGAYITSPSWYPRSTTLQITPSGGAAVSGSSTAFTAIVSSGKTEITGNVSWSVDAGSLDKTNGITVIFTAPTVTANESVTISAKFSGQGVFQPSSTTTQVTVTPPPPVEATATTLKISPTMFEVHSGGTLVLSASLSPSDAPSETITWSISPSGTGSLSSTAGSSVTYTAPVVSGNTTVTIVASFAGNEQYAASSDSSQGNILPQEVVLKTSTVLKISPSTFSIQSNRTQVLNVTLTDASGNVLTGKTITWSISPSGTGSLSSTAGSSVTYTAPTVQANTSVTITASFAGDESYVGSKDSSAGTLTALPSMPSISAADLYVVTFDNALMTNVKLQGPVMMNGTSVTMISADVANMTTFTLGHMNLNASEMDVVQAQFFVTYANFGTESGIGGVEVTGGQSVNIGPIASANYENGTMYVVQMLGSSATLANFESGNEQIGGSEPYVPNLITTPECDISQVYHIDGPVTYGLLVQESSSITMGRIDIKQFSFEHPNAYSLDRPDNTYTATNRWLLKSASATGLNIKAYMIYFQCTAVGVSVVATGEDSMMVVIPYGYNSGREVSVSNLGVHAVFFSGDSLQLGSFILSIE